MEAEKKSNGALIGLVIIVIILVIGGVYIWVSSKNTQSQSGIVTDQDAAALNALSQDSATTDTSTGVDASTIH